jgi:hypothetical protein
MDHQSIVDHGPASSTVEGNMVGGSANRSAPPSVSAGIAAANMYQPKSAETLQRFPGEDGRPSLAAMAYRDLDAALQLLAERAQYITGASGAMIALRRGEHNDMLCRASVGSSAPELGALLSMEYGFSGESVRTRQALRCDDAERDPRVNREGCRQLSIASVVVMPVLSDRQVLGVFELFSGKPHAFAERDLSALQRLSEMVETAVKYAVAAQTVPALQEQAAVVEEPLLDDLDPEVEILESHSTLATPDLLSVAAEGANAPVLREPVPREPEKTEPEKTELLPTEALTTEPDKVELTTPPETAPRKPLFWSAATQTPANGTTTAKPAESVALPAVLRNWHKCQACGFPVSQGRTFCVECEEKQWRGQRLPQASAGAGQQAPLPPHVSRAIEPASGTAQTPASHPSSHAATGPPEKLISAAIESPPVSARTLEAPQDVRLNVREHVPGSDKSGSDKSGSDKSGLDKSGLDKSGLDKSIPFLSSAAESESWLAANKYILGALTVVAVVIAAIAWLH